MVSSVEQKLLREARPDKSIQIVSTITEVPGSKTPFALRRDWLFIGGFQHTPNIDAVLFFAKDIYPLVSEHLHDAKFYIIGDKAPPEVAALATERIVVAGLQRDIRPFFDSVKLSIAPLRFGAGVKGKINQSMAFGVPVVATSLAIEGMELQDREDILVADEPTKLYAHWLSFTNRNNFGTDFQRMASGKHAPCIQPIQRAKSWSFCSAMSISDV